MVSVPVSLTTAGAGADDSSFRPSISADGRFVGFESDADNLSSADNDNVLDVFRRDLVGPVPECSPVTLVVAGSIATSVALPCIDEDADPLTRSIVTSPVHGTLGLVDQAAGTVIYTPDPGYVGPDTFTFRATDASGPSPPASASLTVTAGVGGPPPPPPPPCSDCDGDRYPSTIDCNDRDPATHPGAVDKPGNKIDEDCTGTDAPFSEALHRDADFASTASCAA